MAASHSSRTPDAAYQYFRQVGVTEHPVIAATFGPGRTGNRWRWRRYIGRKYVSASWLRKMRATEGVTDVQLSAGGHLADFTVAELLRRPRTARLASRDI